MSQKAIFLYELVDKIQLNDILAKVKEEQIKLEKAKTKFDDFIRT